MIRILVVAIALFSAAVPACQLMHHNAVYASSTHS
jgi:hypothetical protein